MARRLHARRLRVLTLGAAARAGIVELGRLKFRCAIGRSGLRATKREGDGATPRGRFQLLQMFYRARWTGPLLPPPTGLSARPLVASDGWCDAVGDRNYNRRICHPYSASAERLWREDELYDVLVVLSHNTRPRVQGHGSAIFIHIARPGFKPTEGCIALRRQDLYRMLANVCVGDTIDTAQFARPKRSATACRKANRAHS